MKIKALAASAIVLSGLVLSASPSFADNNGNGKGEGHTPITICHNGHLITVDDDATKQGHSNHAEDIFPEDLGRPVTEADCAAPVPADPDPIISSSQSVFYDCSQPVKYELITTTVRRASGTETVTELSARPLNEEEVLIHCNPVPGDKPTEPDYQTDPVEKPDQVFDDQTPAVTPTPTALVEQAVPVPNTTAPVPTPTAAPLVNTGGPAPSSSAPETAVPDQLANTGFDVQSLLLGLGAIGLGVGALKLRKKLA